MSKKKDFEFEGDTSAYSGTVPMIKEPVDKNNVAFLLMFLFGIAALLPWNAVLTALDFFTEKVSCDVSHHSFRWVNTNLTSCLVSQSMACSLLFKSSSCSMETTSLT